MTKKRLLYVGHGHHNRTKSTVFLIDLLQTAYDVSRFDLDPQVPDCYADLEKLEVKDFDVVVVFQVMPSVDELKKRISWRHGVFFPMYDYYQGCMTLDRPNWYEYADFTIVNFSRTLHEKLASIGFDSKYVQYFPKPHKDALKCPGSEKSLYFWQRLTSLNLPLVAKVCKDVALDRVHLHKVLDPSETFTPVPKDSSEAGRFFARVKMTESTWYDTREKMTADMLKSAIYMAPRPYEGIGMGFLEAMAYGRCVIAPDCPTMNEYITDGENGFLYEWKDGEEDWSPAPVKLSPNRIRDVQRKAYDFICRGYERWQKDQQAIIGWMADECVPDKTKIEAFAKKIGWIDSPIEDQPRMGVEELERHVVLKKPVRRDWLFGSPDVTVITVVFNAVKSGRKAQFVQCLESVQRQCDVRVEHLVVDGGSTDGTVELVKSFVNENVRIRLFSMRDDGIYDGMNRGLALAKGKYVIFLNSDDFYHDPTGLRESFQALERTQCDFSYAPVVILDEKTGKPKDHPNAHPDVGKIFASMEFSHQSVMIRREAFLNIHGFDLRYRSAADFDSVLRLILTGSHACYVPHPFVTFRLGGFSCANMAKSQREAGTIFSRLYERYAGIDMTPEQGHLMYLTGIVPAVAKDRLFRYYVSAFCGGERSGAVDQGPVDELYAKYLKPADKVLPGSFWEVSGLYATEPWGAWASQSVNIKVRLQNSLRGQCVRAELVIGSFRVSDDPARVSVFANGQLLDVLDVVNVMPERKLLVLPPEITKAPVLKLDILTDKTVNPAKAGLSGDNRDLGLSFSGAYFQSCSPKELEKPVTEIGKDDASRVRGLYPVEPWGAWAAREVAVKCMLPPELRGQDVALKLAVGAFQPKGEDTPLTVTANGERIGEVAVHAGMPAEYEVLLPAKVTNAVRLFLSLSVPKTWVPAEFGQGDDRRELGIAFSKIVFSQVKVVE